MNLSLQEVDHLLKSLETMSAHDVARAREQIAPGVVDHLRLVQKLQDYRSPAMRTTLTVGDDGVLTFPEDFLQEVG